MHFNTFLTIKKETVRKIFVAMIGSKYITNDKKDRTGGTLFATKLIDMKISYNYNQVIKYQNGQESKETLLAIKCLYSSKTVIEMKMFNKLEQT